MIGHDAVMVNGESFVMGGHLEDALLRDFSHGGEGNVLRADDMYREVR